MIASILGPTTTTAADPPIWWGALPGTTTLKLTAPIASGIDLLSEISVSLSRLAATAEIAGSAGLGIYYAGFDASTSADVIVEALGLLRSACAKRGGTCVVVRAPADVKSAVDVWGPVKGYELMAAIKKSFDPDRRLAPGRFVKGL